MLPYQCDRALFLFSCNQWLCFSQPNPALRVPKYLFLPPKPPHERPWPPVSSVTGFAAQCLPPPWTRSSSSSVTFPSSSLSHHSSIFPSPTHCPCKAASPQTHKDLWEGDSVETSLQRGAWPFMENQAVLLSPKHHLMIGGCSTVILSALWYNHTLT